MLGVLDPKFDQHDRNLCPIKFDRHVENKELIKFDQQARSFGSEV